MYHPSNSTSFGYTDDLVRSLKGVPELRTKDQLSPEAGLQNIFKPRSSGTSGHSIVFIDRAIASYQELASDVTPGTEVITLDPSGDEIHQITNVLDQRHHITSLQIVSHGSAGGFQLGRTYYNLNTLSQRSSEVASWANALTPDANILLYGCAIAANHPGIQFIDYLSQITGANVAASNNLTGNALLGGDWNLEVATGEIDYGPAFNLKALEHYRGVLDTSYLSDLNWTAIANGWGPVEKNMSNGEQSAGDGHPLTLNGVTYAKGLGVHANSEVDYTLGGTYTNFLANIGIDAEVGGKGSVVFQVWGDGTQLYDSGLVTGLSSTKLVNVNVTGKQKLQLIVTDGGDGNGYDHADWAMAQLVIGAGSPLPPPALGLVSETVISGLIQPTTFDWSPDGQRMYIAQKNGVVQVAVNNVLQSKPFTDISAEVNDTSDRGLLGMAINPYFGQNKGQDFIYLSFTYDPPETRGQTGLAGPDANGNRPDRVVRVTADPTTNYTTTISGSEVVLLGKNDLWQYISRPDGDSTDDFSIPPSGIVNGTTIKAPPSLIDGNGNIRDYIADDSQSHSVGQLRFGLDGALYVSIGDGTSYNAVDRRAVRVQDVDNLSGKLLRIDPLTGQGLTDNPFYSGDPNSNRSKVWSYGFRNPFRFTIQPGTGNIYVGDVGWNTWEEIDVATKGGNFGWPYYEGVPQNAGYSNLPQAQSFYASGQPVVRPLLTRNHNPALNPDNLGSTALIMGTFYTGNVYPSNYQGALFYNDVGLGRVYSTLLNPDGTVKSTQLVDNIPYIVDMETGPDGYLYYDSLYGGQIDRWKLG